MAGIPYLTLHGLRRSFGALSEWVEVPVGIAAQIQGHKPSATAEKHYRKRPIDLLRMWHVKIEKWMLEQAGLEQPMGKRHPLQLAVFQWLARWFIYINCRPYHLTRLKYSRFGMVSYSKDFFGLFENDIRFKRRAVRPFGDNIGKKSFKGLDINSGFM